MRLDLFDQLKYQQSTKCILLPVSIKYFVRDILCDVNNYACVARTFVSVHDHVIIAVAAIRLRHLQASQCRVAAGADCAAACFVSVVEMLTVW